MEVDLVQRPGEGSRSPLSQFLFSKHRKAASVLLGMPPSAIKDAKDSLYKGRISQIPKQGVGGAVETDKSIQEIEDAEHCSLSIPDSC